MLLQSLAVAAAFLAAAVARPLPQSFENVLVQRTVDLTHAYVRELVKIDAEVLSTAHIEDASEPLMYYYAVPKDVATGLAAIQAAVNGQKTHLLPVTDIELAGDVSGELVLFGIQLPQDTTHGSKISLEIGEVYTGVLEPLPAKVRQKDPQTILFNTTRSHVSVYESKQSLTTIRCVTQNIKDLASNTDFSDESAKTFQPGRGATIQLTAKAVIPPGESKVLSLLYEYPLPLPVIRNLNRQVWVSHWGDAVSFVESYDVANIGAKLDGPYSRLDFQESQSGRSTMSMASIGQLAMVLPPRSSSLYHVDLVGSVSTARIDARSEGTVYAIQPRFPIMGGWKYNFTIGWDNKLSQFVEQAADGTYSVTVPLVFGPNEVYYESVDNTFIFPEGAQDIELVTPGLQAKEQPPVFSYLDTAGRPAVTIHSGNLLPEHREMTAVFTYRLPTTSALRKPLTYAGYMFSAFMTVLIVSKLDLSL